MMILEDPHLKYRSKIQTYKSNYTDSTYSMIILLYKLNVNDREILHDWIEMIKIFKT